VFIVVPPDNSTIHTYNEGSGAEQPDYACRVPTLRRKQYDVLRAGRTLPRAQPARVNHLVGRPGGAASADGV